MKILDRFVDKPLPIFLAAGLVVLGGVWSLTTIPVKRTPSIEIPYALVTVAYLGASPEEIESELTIEIEEELAGLESLRHQTSVASQGISTTFIEFQDRTDMRESLRDVRDKVDLAEVDLPSDAEGAVVHELSFDNEPIALFTLTGDVGLERLRELGEQFEPELESVPGVRAVDVFGGLAPEVRIRADPQLLALHDLTLSDLSRTLERHSRAVPSGRVRGQRSDRLLRGTGEFTTLEELRNVAIGEEPDGVVMLRDVARIDLAQERVASGSWLDGRASVTLIVQRRAEVNTLETARLLKEKVALLSEELPAGVTVTVTQDASNEIGKMIGQLGKSAAVGMVLVVGVLFAVFGPRQAILVGFVLPFSLLFTVIGLNVFGMEISNVALFALILVLGLVVDGAIIVGEAIYREREDGASPAAAAKAALSRVGTPVIAADLTTVAAFLPMLLMVGVMGQFMSVMPKVVVFALIGSVFVDHFLLPAASARFDKGKPKKATRISNAPDGLPWFSAEMPRLQRGYRRVLERALTRRLVVVVTAGAALTVTALVVLSGIVPSIFLPKTDQAHLSIEYALPSGTGLAETNRVGMLLSGELAAFSEVDRAVLTTGDTGALNSQSGDGSRLGPEYGKIHVELSPPGERERGQSEIASALRERLHDYAGVEIRIAEPGEGPPTGAALAVLVKGDELKNLAHIASAAKEKISSLDGAVDVRVDYDATRPEVRIEVDRARAESEFGISPDAVSRALLTAFHGIEVGRMWMGGDRVDIRLEAEGDLHHELEAVRELPLRAANGEIVPLSALANVGLGFSHDTIFRRDARRTITVRADTAPGTSSVELESAARAGLASLQLPLGYSFEFAGETEERDRSYESLWQALIWGVLMIYVVIAIQFDSLLQPFIVLLTLPLAVVGVTAGLVATSTPFSFVVFVGVVSLTGIVVNDGIVMVDAINRTRRAGMPIGDAIRTAALRRMRAVILTTITTIAGLLPLTLGIADGAEFWSPLGVTIISGMLIASTLTLVVVPVLYSLLAALPTWRLPLPRRVRHRLPRFGPSRDADPSVALGGVQPQQVPFDLIR